MISQFVKEFHAAFNLPWRVGRPHVHDQELNELRLDLIEEEYFELIDALLDEDGPKQNPDPVAIADALGDLAYVVYGAAAAFGIDLDAVVAEIHRSNMTKLGEDGNPVYREDGKVLKGPNFRPPNLAPLLNWTA